MVHINPNIVTGQSDAPAFNVGGGLSGPRQVASSHGSGSVVQNISQYQAAQSSTEMLRFPLDTAKFFFVMSFQAYERVTMLDVNATLNTDAQVLLPVPLNMNDNHAVSYTETPFNPFYGNILNQGFNNAQQLFESAINNLGGGQATTDTGAGFLSSLQGLAGDLPGALPAIAAGTLASLNAVGAFGYAPNQFVTILLKGPNYKQHSFTWHLVPKNYDESIMIQRIIRLINNATAPGLEWGGSVFSFPAVVQCAFWPNWSYLYRFKPAVITRVSVNYMPGGVASFYHKGETDAVAHNPPESVQIQIDLLELEYWLKNDFKEIGAIPTGDGVTASAEERSNRINTTEPGAFQQQLQDLRPDAVPTPTNNPGINVNRNFLEGISGQ